MLYVSLLAKSCSKTSKWYICRRKKSFFKGDQNKKLGNRVEFFENTLHLENTLILHC